MRSGVGGHQGAEAFSGSLDSSVAEPAELCLVRVVDHRDHRLGGVHVHLGILEVVLVRGLGNSETVITNQVHRFMVRLSKV